MYKRIVLRLVAINALKNDCIAIHTPAVSFKCKKLIVNNKRRGPNNAIFTCCV